MIHFSLLREVVDFNSEKGKLDQRTQEANLSRCVAIAPYRLREYLILNFQVKLEGFKYDLERVIDDIPLLCIFVGNDFLPHLPSLDIAAQLMSCSQRSKSYQPWGGTSQIVETST